MHAVNDLIIGFRVFSKGSFEEQQAQILSHFSRLQKLQPAKIFVATKENDKLIPVLSERCDKVLVVKEAEWGFKKPVEVLLKAASGHPLLMLSVGVKLFDWQIDHAATLLFSRNFLSLGWRILSQENDGSYLGKLSYNTALLYHDEFLEYYEEVGGIPDYVENGALGEINMKLVGPTSKPVPIGGQEELACQLRLFKHFKNKRRKLFGHIKHYGLNLDAETGHGVSVREKVIRKLMVAEVYRNKEDVDPSDFMDSWTIF